VQGEVEYEVPPLASLEAVSLFCARSGLDSSDEISELCAHLDNLPLAVELAAARTKALTPAQILERLSSRLDLLKGGRDADPRHQTLRATIEWSYDLLSDEEQRLFRALSIFAGGCTLEAAEEVADADLDTLQSLVEKSLLRFSKGRYWMLETIREYGIDQLVESDELDPLGQRHSQYFLELAVASEPELWAQKTDAWLPRLDPEQANFRAALGRAIGHADAEAAVALAGCLYPYWEIRARQGEARAWLTRALALEGNVPTASRAKALIAAGRAATWHSDWSAAVELLEEAAEACRELGDVAGVGRCLGFIGHYRLFTGDPEGAAVALDEGVQLARSSGDRQSLARALSNAAWSPLEAGDFDGARRMWEEGAALARIEGMKPALALCLIHVGYAEVLAGRVEQASSALSEGTALFDELGGTTWTPVAHRYLGLAALLSGQLDRAEDLLRTSLQAGKEEAPQFHLLYWIEALAAVAAGKGQTERAATLWGATYALFDELRLVALQENRHVRDRYKNHVRAAIDQAPQAWTRGRAMTLREAVSYALREDDGEDAAATID
jgi:tetratricopeptide (TPR) repeat protein